MAANGLSCQFPIKANLEKEETEPDIDKFILAKLNCHQVSPVTIDKLTPIL